MRCTISFLLITITTTTTLTSAVQKKDGGFVLDDAELAKRGANGKPISFKMSNKGDGKGLTEDFDDVANRKNDDDDDDVGIPGDIPGDAGGDHDWSRWPFTDVGSPFDEAGFPFNDHHEGEDEVRISFQ